jgi:Rrf2 family iron-sulfur cluster assembly transcriptional regulator
MLSVTSKYALLSLSQLAMLPRGKSMLGRNLSEKTQIPGNYLSKVMLVLRDAGMIAATRGSGGGYRLTRPADTIRLIDVIELFDGNAARPACFLGGTHCSDHSACSAHQSWRGVRTSYVQFLESTTVADITHDHENAGLR